MPSYVALLYGSLCHLATYTTILFDNDLTFVAPVHRQIGLGG